MVQLQDKNIWPGWELKGLIGVGSRSRVYEMERVVYGSTEKAALKIISVPKDDAELRRILHGSRDARSAAEALLEQKHIVINQYAMMRQMSGAANFVNCEDIRCVSYEDRPGWDICIKMELLTPLPAAVGDEVSEANVIRIGTDLCRALALCGRYGIVHRNIKPENIFLSRSGEYKLGDFGLSASARSGATADGDGSFAAPEVLRGEESGPAADLYALGLVLYWLLNERRLPFVPSGSGEKEREAAARRRAAGEALPEPAHGSPALRRIVLRACAAEPARRYRDAEELLRELTALQLQPKPAAQPAKETAAPETGEKRKKNRGFFGGLIAALLVIALIVGLLTADRIRAATHALPTEAPPTAAPQVSTAATESPAVTPDPAWVESFSAGDRLRFGSYEQDKDLNNGREPIEWIVLERSGTQLTLLSLRCLDTQPFHADGGRAGWADSELRAWLNGDFVDSAFDEAQRAALIEAAIDNPANPVSGVGEEETTVDRIWLLSMQELERYFPADAASAAACATPYAVSRGAFQQEESKNCWWWLRTGGKDPEHAAYVYSTGQVAVNGGRLASEGGGLRPVLRIDLARCGREGEGPEKILPRPLTEAETGDTVLFGHFGPESESIAWIVLDKKDERLLLLSRDCLETGAFHGEQVSVTWGESALRAWLNGDFLETAFTAPERSLLPVTDQKMKPNPAYDTYLGRSTSDRVFLLSFDEAQKYLPAAAERGCGVSWWLRTPGMDRGRAVYVDGSGLIDLAGAEVSEAGFGVRPAIWVSVD